MWKSFAVLLLLVISLPFARQGEEYKFTIDIGSPDVLCPSPNYTCKDGNLHYLCEPIRRVNPRCICFNPVELTNKLRQYFLRGTNGLRNKVATGYKISNMNIVYWSSELEKMAERYVLECSTKRDPCLVIGEKHLNVSQNMAVMLKQGNLDTRWPNRFVRHWYLELGTKAEEWSDVEEKIIKGKIKNFTNMMYPPVEFMGCSGAQIKEGLFFVCYYHPPYDKSLNTSEFLKGQPCTQCESDRVGCSKTFVGLCGVDYDLVNTSTSTKNTHLFALELFACILIFSFVIYVQNC